MGAIPLGLGPAVQELVALPADKLLRRRVELPRQHLVYLDYPVLAVVDGNEVLDGVEGGHPLLLALYDEFEELGVLLRPLFERIEHAVEGRRKVAYFVLGIDLYPLIDAGLAVGYPLYDLDVSPDGAGYRPLDEEREQYAAYGDREYAGEYPLVPALREHVVHLGERRPYDDHAPGVLARVAALALGFFLYRLKVGEQRLAVVLVYVVDLAP